jgi:hypothetical protein
LQDAINALGEGDGTIRVAPGTWHDCGVQPHGNVTYVAAIPGQSIFDGKVCEEKAALVMRGQSMHVEADVPECAPSTPTVRASAWSAAILPCAKPGFATASRAFSRPTILPATC